jgi:hypothetical protein
MEPAGVEPASARQARPILSYYRKSAYSQCAASAVTLAVTPHNNATNSSNGRPAWRISARSVPFPSSLWSGMVTVILTVTPT